MVVWGGLGLTWQVNVSSSIIDSITKTYAGCYEIGLGWFRGGSGCFGVVWVFPRTLMGRIISQKNPFEVNLPFIG